MFRIPTPLRLSALALLSLAAATNAPAGNDLHQALSGGEIDFFLRYRYERVDDQVAGEGYANTVRTALGYKTGLFHDFGAYVQFEDVRDLSGDDAYNVPGVTPANRNRPVIADPSGTEVQQANLRYRGIPKSTASVGRMEIEHRKAPLHRYLGNILWRQNWQSFDAFRFESGYLPATRIDYAYLWNVNRIFGEDSSLGDYAMNSHVLKAEYSGLPVGVIEPYFYLLDFDDAAATNGSAGFGSTATGGIRVNGSHAFVTSPYKLLYTGEVAWQGDYAGNPRGDFDHLYYLAELGINRAFTSAPLQSVTLKGTLEVLEGDGRTAFNTPLGTNHAFQGWADKFLLTPADGIRDIFGTLAVQAWDATFLAVYHQFQSDNLDYDLGSEWDLQVSRKFFKHYTVLLKYAHYEGDDNATNLARARVRIPRSNSANGGAQTDRDIFWAQVEVAF